mmetsp:Transcript_31083/g.34392  ORF Transcript_31083/g.34392 Transcript_31083/m.34392 type:complete len:283 (+) Transcript_31083:93-941(+)
MGKLVLTTKFLISIILGLLLLAANLVVTTFGLHVPIDSRRRRVIISSSALIFGGNGAASAAPEVAEVIRKGASKIPGYGPSDVYYPESWKGKWRVTREIIDDQYNDDKKKIVQYDRIVRYDMRFIPSIEAGATVMDRGYSQANLERVLLVATSSNDDEGDDNSVQSCQWTETNPNDLRVVFNNGARKEIKVTKRSSEPNMEEETVSSSEFQRITTESTVGGIPVITARRILSKWKGSSEKGIIEGIEITYDMGSGGDLPSIGGTSSGPKVISKSRIHLERSP